MPSLTLSLSFSLSPCMADADAEIDGFVFETVTGNMPKWHGASNRWHLSRPHAQCSRKQGPDTLFMAYLTAPYADHMQPPLHTVMHTSNYAPYVHTHKFFCNPNSRSL